MKILIGLVVVLVSLKAYGEQLDSRSSVEGVEVSTARFSPGETVARHTLQGELNIDFSDVSITQRIRVPFLPDLDYKLPPIVVSLVSDGQDLVPRARGLNITKDPFWDYIVGAGRSWQEGAVSVASLPLTLVFRPVNCTHNGLIRIEYNAVEILKTSILVGQETCHFIRFDIVGDGRASFSRDQRSKEGAIEDARVRAAWQEEKAGILPVYSFDQFEKDYGADLALFTTGLPDNDDLSTAGFYYDGKHFSDGCRTRFGPYPYCNQMIMTSFSTAKTAFTAVTLMAMAQQFGESVYDQTIGDLLVESKNSAGEWGDVTLNDIGDMASGNFSDSRPLADPEPGQFYQDGDRRDKLASAFSWPHARAPGTYFVYQTADTFIQINAMDEYLRRHKAAETDSFRYFTENILKPLSVSPDVMNTRRTREAGRVNSGTAFGGMGLWWTPDAIVKIARLMLIDKGVINGRQVLHPGALGATMQLDPSDRGLGTRFFGQFYNNNTWAWPVRSLGSQFWCDPFVPIMSGLSGVRVFMMPNGLIYYYFNDAQAFPGAEAIIAADKIRPFCTALAPG